MVQSRTRQARRKSGKRRANENAHQTDSGHVSGHVPLGILVKTCRDLRNLLKFTPPVLYSVLISRDKERKFYTQMYADDLHRVEIS